MHPNMNEDVAFERLKDLQREMENARLAAGSLHDLAQTIGSQVARIWSRGREVLGGPAGAR